MPSAIPSTMDVILPVIERRLRLVTALPAERILPWVGEELPPHTQADQDLVLRLAGITPDQGWQGGGGRYTPRVTERLEVVVRTRLALDESDTARQWIVNQTYGHVKLRTSVVDALLSFFPTDSDGNVLVTDPLALVPSRAPKQDGRARPIDWGNEVLSFEVNYLYKVDLTLDLTAVADEDS